MDNEKTTKALIKDNLINAKLVSGLNALGLNADDYLLHLPETIFTLMEFKTNLQREILFDQYFLLSNKVEQIDIIKFPELLNELVSEIYDRLLEAKRAGF